MLTTLPLRGVSRKLRQAEEARQPLGAEDNRLPGSSQAVKTSETRGHGAGKGRRTCSWVLCTSGSSAAELAPCCPGADAKSARGRVPWEGRVQNLRMTRRGTHTPLAPLLIKGFTSRPPSVFLMPPISANDLPCIPFACVPPLSQAP